MEIKGQFDVYDWADETTGLKIRLAEFDLITQMKMAALLSMAQTVPAMKEQIDTFNNHVLDQMELTTPRLDNEAPLYYWVRAMKVQNRLSFEDGQYTIPDNLASCIVRCPDARGFVRLLGGS